MNTQRTYDYDVIIWDTLGKDFSEEAAAKPMGGSEYEVVQLLRALKADGKTARVFTRETQYTWQSNAARPVRCQVLIVNRYSTMPPPGAIRDDRTFIRATDFPGGSGKGGRYAHLGDVLTDRGNGDAVQLLCVSKAQAAAFPAIWAPHIIPMTTIDDYVYDYRQTPKNKNKFVYLSAAMKGLNETVDLWRDLRRRYPTEMRSAELHVTTNWDEPNFALKALMRRDNNIFWQGRLSPRESQTLLSDAQGLFMVNSFAETFGSAQAAVLAAGGIPWVLCKNGIGGLAESIPGWAFDNAHSFEVEFLRVRRGEPSTFSSAINGPHPGPDFRVSTVYKRWKTVLGLDEEVDGRVDKVLAVPDKIARLATPTAKPRVALAMLVGPHETREGLTRALDSVRPLVDDMFFQCNLGDI